MNYADADRMVEWVDDDGQQGIAFLTGIMGDGSGRLIRGPSGLVVERVDENGAVLQQVVIPPSAFPEIRALLGPFPDSGA